MGTGEERKNIIKTFHTRLCIVAIESLCIVRYSSFDFSNTFPDVRISRVRKLLRSLNFFFGCSDSLTQVRFEFVPNASTI